MRQVEVYKGRTMQLPVSLAFNVSLDSFAK